MPVNPDNLEIRGYEGKPQDEIVIMLPDGRIVRGHALIVNEPDFIQGGGHLAAEFDLAPWVNGPVCIMVVACNDFSKGRIHA